MAVKGERRRTNTWGPFYITDECDGCGICEELAPQNFGQSWGWSYYAVVQQPETKDEVLAMRRAMEACPRQCIGDDWDA